MYQNNSTPSEKALMALIIHRESSGNPTAKNPGSSAQGLFQFITGTWQWVGQLAGIDLTLYPTAATAPADVQMIAGLLLLRMYGPNSSKSWKASGPYPSFLEVQLMLSAVGISNP